MTHHISQSLSPITEPFHLMWRNGHLLCHAAPTPRRSPWDHGAQRCSASGLAQQGQRV